MRNEMTSVLVSIIIPIFNMEKYLAKCLESVFQQTFSSFEVIAINDGSTDKSESIIDSFSQEYPNRITKINKENGGLASARNCAFDLVQGKYVTFLDADDYLAPDYLKTLVEKAELDALDMVCSGQHKVTEDGEVLKTIKYRVVNGQCLQRRLNISGKLYRTEYVMENDIHFPEGKEYEDNSFNLQAMFLSDKVGFLEYEGYYQVVHEGSITSKPIRADRLPFEEWEAVVARVRSENERNADIELFDFTFMSLVTYLLMVRCRGREYLENKEGYTASDTAVIVKRIQAMVVELFPDYMKNRYRMITREWRLSILQKMATTMFYCFCRRNMLGIAVQVFHAL